MLVPGGADALGYQYLEQAIGAGAVVPADLDGLEHAEQPERLALVGGERVPGLCAVLSGGHASLLPDLDMIRNSLISNCCKEDNLTWNHLCQVPRPTGSAAGASSSRARWRCSTCSTRSCRRPSASRSAGTTSSSTPRNRPAAFR